jgi:hypothetical protein
VKQQKEIIWALAIVYWTKKGEGKWQRTLAKKITESDTFGPRESCRPQYLFAFPLSPWATFFIYHLKKYGRYNREWKGEIWPN